MRSVEMLRNVEKRLNASIPRGVWARAEMLRCCGASLAPYL